MLARLVLAARPVAARGGARTLAPSVVPVDPGVRCYHEVAHHRSEIERRVVFFDRKAVDVGTALVGKASRGAIVKLQLKVQDGVIRDVKVRALGDSATENSFRAELIIGRSLDEAECFTSTGSPSWSDAKTSGSALVKQAIQVAIANYKKKHESVRDHFRNPRNVGTLDKKAMEVGVALIGKASKGGVIRMHILVRDGVIEDAKFKAVGSTSVIASGSCATEMIIGKRLDEAESLVATAISSHLKLPSTKAHCSVLATEAVLAAVSNFRGKSAIVRNTSIAPCRHVGSLYASSMGMGPTLVLGERQQAAAVRDTAVS